MTETQEAEITAEVAVRGKRIAATFGRTRRKTGPDVTEFNDWLSRLDVVATPTVHVNGPGFHSAVACVDFGVPLKQNKLPPEQAAELSDRLKKLAREVLAPKDVDVRINHDGPNGVWYASV